MFVVYVESARLPNEIKKNFGIRCRHADAMLIKISIFLRSSIECSK